MKVRIYGNIKDTKMNQAIIDANIKLFLNKKRLQEVNSIKNGFFEIITEIDDSRIEGGQQLRVSVEKKGYQKQEHLVFTTEGSFNLDVELEPVVPFLYTPKNFFNRLPLVLGGAVLLALLVGGMIKWLLLRLPFLRL